MSSEYSNSEPIKLSKNSYTILCHKIKKSIVEFDLNLNIKKNCSIQFQFRYWKLFFNVISVLIANTIIESNLNVNSNKTIVALNLDFRWTTRL